MRQPRSNHLPQQVPLQTILLLHTYSALKPEKKQSRLPHGNADAQHQARIRPRRAQAGQTQSLAPKIRDRDGEGGR